MASSTAAALASASKSVETYDKGQDPSVLQRLAKWPPRSGPSVRHLPTYLVHAGIFQAVQ